jgi:hypothetical protein
MHKFELVSRGETSVLICSDCKRPFLDVENGEVRIKTKHGDQIHENRLTVEHLRMIAIEMWRQAHPPERW